MKSQSTSKQQNTIPRLFSPNASGGSQDVTVLLDSGRYPSDSPGVHLSARAVEELSQQSADLLSLYAALLSAQNHQLKG